jgi:hypothetical protein
MSGYGNGKIYKLIHSDGRFYIGSTCDYPSSRFNKHKQSGLVREFVGDWDNVRIEVILKYPCENRQQLNIKEQEIIDSQKNELCLNKIRAKRRTRHEEFKETYERIKGTDKDYYATHREKNREKNRLYAKMYYEKHKERLKQESTNRTH